MSKHLNIAVLVLLIALLGAVKFALNKQTDPPKPAEPAAQSSVQQQAAAKAEAEKRTEMMKKSNEESKKAEAKAKAAHPTSTAGAMDITSDWYKKRSDGEKGLQKVMQNAGTTPSSAPSSAPK